MFTGWNATMRALDASSIIHGWENYPIGKFPQLWKWLGTQCSQNALCIPDVAFEEVKHKAPECAVWLKDVGIQRLPVTQAILQISITIKAEIGVTDDNYHPKGVGENDLFIIATAKASGCELISNEAKQFDTPKESRKLKIPAVCKLGSVRVNCINFLELIKLSDAIF
jgi:Domain of unknown function (DUF4411)